MSVQNTEAQRTTRWLLVLFLGGLCSRGYGYYNETMKVLPETWTDVLHGTAHSPEQYRVGVVEAAYWMTRCFSWHGYLKLSRAFGILDLVGSMVAVMLLYSLLVEGRVYAGASHAEQWFGSAGFAALVMYLVNWSIWYQKVSTLPAACLVAVMLWLWTPRRGKVFTATRTFTISALFLATTLLLSSMRADVALMACLGFLVGSVVSRDTGVALPRGAAIATSMAGAAIAVGVQLYLMMVRYPAANYGGVHAFMFPHDWWRLLKWSATLIFTAPFFWTVVQVARRREWGKGAGGALLLGTMGYAVLWIAMGRLDEVRIFLPMALATAPLTVEMAMRRIAEGEA